jgi:tryptophan synthase alpha chain
MYMSHLVLGYPTLEDSIRTAEQYIAAGYQILELQIPFSHPTADGPVITQACREAVERHNVTVEDCLAAIAGLRQRFPQQEIIVMTYLNRIFAFGLAHFCHEMENLGIKHLIVPDLPVDSPQALAIAAHDVKLVPVLAANVAPERLDKFIEMGFDFFYLMSDFKITGSTFSLHPRLEAVIARIRGGNPQARIGIGFGIGTAEQVRLVTQYADYAIIGSALIKGKMEGRLEEVIAALKVT